MCQPSDIAHPWIAEHKGKLSTVEAPQVDGEVPQEVGGVVGELVEEGRDPLTCEQGRDFSVRTLEHVIPHSSWKNSVVRRVT